MECWVYDGPLNPNGYGVVRLEGQNRYAHRLAYEILVGPIPPGLVIDHLCRNKACYNPAHLEAVTQKVNVLRGQSPMAMFARRDCCSKGHPYVPENTYMRYGPKGHRRCKRCHADYEMARQKRRKAVL